MNNANNLYITYLDEHKIEKPQFLSKYYTIVSVSAKKSDYISQIEVQWKSMRDRYNIPDGQIIHFAEVKFLLNQAAPQKFKPTWKAIFDDGAGGIDYNKLYSFFFDILSIINNAPLIIQYTGLEINKNNQIRLDKGFKTNAYQPPYIAFKEHLNLMAVYLTGFHASNFQKSNLKITKLRYDGDLGFGERDDIKEAYHHVITLGTRHFRSEIAKQLFDEVRFIGKSEVGHAALSHAGNEIVDFISSFLSRDLWQIDTRNIPLRFPLASPKSSLDPLPFILPKVINRQKISDTTF